MSKISKKRDSGDVSTSPDPKDPVSGPLNIKNALLTDRYLQSVLVLTFIGLILRIYNLAFNSLWLDEATTHIFAQHSFAEIWNLNAGGEVNPPLFYWIEHILLLFGDSEFILRLAPAVLGTLTIPVIYLIGREFIDEKGGIIAAALLVFSPYHIYYSQEARAYTTYLLFFSLALLFYLWAIHRDDLRCWLLFALFAALSFWSHFYTIVPIGLVFLHAFYTKRQEISENIRNIKHLAASLGLFVILILPLLTVVMPPFLGRTGCTPTWGSSGIDLISSTFTQFAGSSEILNVFFLILMIVGIVGIYLKDKNSAALIILCIMGSLLVGLLLSSRMPFAPRYMIYLIPFYFVAISGFSLLLPESFDPKKMLPVILVIIIFINVPFLSTYYTTFQKNDWRGFSQIILDNADEGDYVVLLPSYIQKPFSYYYDNSTDGTLQFGANSAVDLERISSSRMNNSAYYVMTGDISAANPEGDAVEWLEKNANYQGRYGNIYIFTS